MKVAPVAVLSSLIISADASIFRELVEKVTAGGEAADAAAEIDTDAAVGNQASRELQTTCWDGSALTMKWHPQYSMGWSSGYCRQTRDCNSPGYSTELACCKGAYAGQTSGYCLSRLPNPPTTSPTESGGLDEYYPDYGSPWSDAYCINKRPLPSGRPTYSTMLECCKAAYGGQMSGKCLAMLPSPPTTSPTNSDFEADFFYPRYDSDWSASGCSNKLPLPFKKNDRPTYATQLECCKAAYGGQMSGQCLSELPNPPTQSPTESGGYDFYYPDYETPWDRATCKNTRPLPFLPGGRPTYDSMVACCKGAYASQISGACLAALPSPPTSSPTESGGLDVWYPNYAVGDWGRGYCINTRPLPSGRITYNDQMSCCSGAYGGQSSHICGCMAEPCYSCKCTGSGSYKASNGLSCAHLDCDDGVTATSATFAFSAPTDG